MTHNHKNEEIYERSVDKHHKEGGSASMAYALTEVIKNEILDKSYLVYNGGGPYGEDGEFLIKRFDVVVTITWGGDPEFWVVMDHDGDCCDLYKSDTQGNVIRKFF
jgi:hypothetical protein